MEPLFTTQTEFTLDEYIKFSETLHLYRFNEKLLSDDENKQKMKQSLKRNWIMVAIGAVLLGILNLLNWISKGGTFKDLSDLIFPAVNILGAIMLGLAIIYSLLVLTFFSFSGISKRMMKKAIKASRKSLEDAYESDAFNRKNSLWSYSFFNDYLEEKTENSYEKFEYSMIHKIIETETNFYILKTINSGYFIVKNNCSPELIEFIKNLKQR